MLARGAPLTVEALADPAERHAVFAAAFAQATDQPAPARTASLDQALSEASLGGEPLFLAMFGLIAARQGLEAAKALQSDEIALDLAGQELERIGRVWTAHGLAVGAERQLHAHLAAVATLCEGLSEAEAHAAIARESAALFQAIPEGQTEPARAALHAALPGEGGGLAAIVPDILGEAAALRAFGVLAGRGRRRRPPGGAGEPRGATTQTVVRACQDFLIRGQRAPLDWLKALQADATELDALLELADAMPADTVELRETAAELTEEMLRRVRELPGEEGAASGRRRSTTCRTASSTSAAARRRWRPARRRSSSAARLADARPDAFRPDLAGVAQQPVEPPLRPRPPRGGARRHRGGGRLCRAPRRRPARRLPARPRRCRSTTCRTGSPISAAARRRWPPAEEAVDIRRALAARPARRLPARPRHVAQQPVDRLSGLGRREEALAAIEEAVGSTGALAAARPDAFRPDLAMSLNNLSNRLSDLGRREEALAAIEEAVDICRELAAARPDAFRPDLAMSLNNLSNRLSDLGRREEALAAIEEAVGLYRRPRRRPARRLPARPRHVAQQPGELPLRPRPARGGLAAIEEAVGIYRELAAAGPTPSGPTSPCRSTTCRTASLTSAGARTALAAIDEAVEVRRALAARPARRFPARSRGVAQQPVGPPLRPRAGARRRSPPARRPSSSAALAAARPKRLPARPRNVAQQPVEPPLRSRPARGGARRHQGGCRDPPLTRRSLARRVPAGARQFAQRPVDPTI